VAFRHDKNHVSEAHPPLQFQGTFYHFHQCVSYAGMVKHSKGRVSRLHKTRPFISFFGWLVGWLEHSSLQP
jgi:hypothetical protein